MAGTFHGLKKKWSDRGCGGKRGTMGSIEPNVERWKNKKGTKQQLILLKASDHMTEHSQSSNVKGLSQAPVFEHLVLADAVVWCLRSLGPRSLMKAIGGKGRSRRLQPSFQSSSQVPVFWLAVRMRTATSYPCPYNCKSSYLLRQSRVYPNQINPHLSWLCQVYSSSNDMKVPNAHRMGTGHNHCPFTKCCASTNISEKALGTKEPPRLLSKQLPWGLKPQSSFHAYHLIRASNYRSGRSLYTKLDKESKMAGLT